MAEGIVPRAAREKLARYCDVFCEDGVFTVPESRTILEAARRAGMGLRIHADELARSGGTMLAAELRAASADHLLFIEEEEIDALAASGTVAVVLPGTAWWMRSRRAPARATDRGGRPRGRRLGLEPRDLLHRVAAGRRRPRVPRLRAVGRGNADRHDARTPRPPWGSPAEVGSLEAGKSADLLVLDAPDDRHLIYHWGVNLVDAVVLRGRVVEGDRT